MKYKMNRAEFISALEEWCGDEYAPLVGFPDQGGFGNVAYVYDQKHKEMLDRVHELTAFLYKKLNMPVVVFIEHPKMAFNQTVLTIKQWKETYDR